MILQPIRVPNISVMVNTRNNSGIIMLIVIMMVVIKIGIGIFVEMKTIEISGMVQKFFLARFMNCILRIMNDESRHELFFDGISRRIQVRLRLVVLRKMLNEILQLRAVVLGIFKF